MTDPFAKLVQFATNRDLDYIEAIREHGSMRAAARALGINKNTINGAIERLRARAAKRDPSMHDYTNGNTLPKGFEFEGVSQWDPATGRWLKSRRSRETNLDDMQDAIRVLAEPFTGLSPIVPRPEHNQDDLMVVYPQGDPHWGLRCWRPEVGQDWDLSIAKRVNESIVDDLVARAPSAKSALLLCVGDNLHMNDHRNVTPTHHHPLDADGRFSKILDVAIENYRHAILRMLEKHEQVTVRIQIGNHDPEASVFLRGVLRGYFHNEDRVTVDNSPAYHWYYRYGKVLIGSTHGDKTKPGDLPLLMATDRPADWGATVFRYWFTGHIHSQNMWEFPGATVESLRTVVPGDSYSASHKYRSGRDMKAIVMHCDLGELHRFRADVAGVVPA